ncbi:hypothetical protein K466DRAFT_581601 [Polyporus arcularius HHB13444]|uniref:Uncharacterized protein n=1 Tax=Polyporus arcularius HHB13444 TaxID=1314778 RepID=A0A5C3PSN0_9APHY|nr:hypothetical protein K466DRAFT_581601 [Polyporus arcularius HHB13444]
MHPVPGLAAIPLTFVQPGAVSFQIFTMRAGFFVALFLSAVSVLAAPSPVEQRDLVDNVETAIDQLFSVTVDLKAIVSEATAIGESIFQEATAEIGSLVTNTAVVAEATSLLSEAESFLGPTGTAIAKDLNNVKNAFSNSASARQDVSAMRPLTMGAAAVLGSMLLGAYAAL